MKPSCIGPCTLYSPFVLEMLGIMSKYGEPWKDDCGQYHIDDFRPYDALAELELKLKEGSLKLTTDGQS
jgi:hypothetical protein